MQSQIKTDSFNKEKYLKADLIDRMINVEKSIAGSFNQKLDSKDTEYFKSLSDEDKQNYLKYLKISKNKKIMSSIWFLLPFFLMGFFSFNLTGNVVADTSLQKDSIFLFGFLWGFLVLTILIFLLFIFYRLYLNNRLNRHIRLITPILSRKHTQ